MCLCVISRIFLVAGYVSVGHILALSGGMLCVGESYFGSFWWHVMCLWLISRLYMVACCVYVGHSLAPSGSMFCFCGSYLRSFW